MKNLLLLSLVTLTSYFATAQRFSAGIIAGTGKAWVKDPPSDRYPRYETKKIETSYYGVQVLMHMHDHVYLGSNVILSKEGFTFGEPKKPNYVNVGMSYIRMSVQPVYYPLKSASLIQPKISAGLSGAYLLDGQSDFTDGNANELGFDTKDIVKTRFDLGYRFEAGLDIKLNRSIRLTSGASYYHGLLTVMEFNRKWKNSNITWNAGVAFRISKR